jgi:hypothetical protein
MARYAFAVSIRYMLPVRLRTVSSAETRAIPSRRVTELSMRRANVGGQLQKVWVTQPRSVQHPCTKNKGFGIM